MGLVRLPYGSRVSVGAFYFALPPCLMYNGITDNRTKGNALSIVHNNFMATEIGETVIQLLENGKRVTTGNIVDLLERKRHALHGAKADAIREILIFIRKKAVM
ncbi:TPA: hypothetical protein ACWV5T_002368 [Salmonella enterica subsp. enterica serovar Muenchen]